MSRVHCLECGNQVVVDPRGLCPEGHEVGSDGARIEHAMGHEATHPDEPEPWVYRIGADEVTVPARPPAVSTVLAAPDRQGSAVGAAAGGRLPAGPSGNGSAGEHPMAAREARPVQAPGLGDATSEDEPADAESLLRELHSLAALDDALAEQGRSPGRAEGNGRAAYPAPTAAAAPPPPPEDVTSPPPVEPSAPTATATPGPEAGEVSTPEAAGPGAAPEPETPRPTRGDPSAIADAFAELSALDLPTAPPAPNGSAGDRSTTAASPDPEDTQPPAAPTAGGAEAGSAAHGGGLSALFAEGPLFTEDGEAPGPAQRNGSGAPAGAGRPRRRRAPAEREYEATLHVVPTPDQGGPTPAASSGQDAGGPPTPPTLAPTGEQASAEPRSAAGGGGTSTSDGHPVPAPEHGSTLDLTSFTARGGAGSRRTRGRRRRLAR